MGTFASGIRVYQWGRKRCGHNGAGVPEVRLLQGGGHRVGNIAAQKHAHIQFNILNRQSLLDAQKNPEKYRDLVVRVAGYCAYFVDLSPMQQAEIIARTEEQMG
jgi:pyruvate-formate lyase